MPSALPRGNRRRLPGVRASCAAALLGLFGPAQAAPDDPPEARGVDTSRPSEVAALREWRAATQHYESAIEQEQSLNGPYSRALIDSLMALGLTHQEHGEPQLAADAFERALQVKRVNDGLFTVEQIPMLRRLEASEAADGNFDAAADVERDLLRLVRMNPDDPQSVAILRDAGDRHLRAYRRYRAGDGPVPVNITLDAGPRIPREAAPAGGPFELWQARSDYSEAIAYILRGGVRDDPRLPDLQRSLIRTYYLEVAASETWPERQTGLYQLGRDGYGRLAWYVVQTSGGGVDLAKALVDLADWELLFARNGVAVERYDEAYRLLLSEHVPEATIRAIFPTDPPIMLPTFEPSPLVTEPPREGTAYLDVSFGLSKYGVARRIHVDQASGAEAEAAADRIVGLIARSRFRPQPTPNQPKGAPVRRVRYYIGR